MPARLSWVSSNLKPSGSIKCNVVRVAAHSRATLPVFGGISGSTRTTCIENLPKHQPMRRSAHAGHTSISLGEHLTDLRGGKFPQPNLHQCPGNSAAHFVKKTVSLNHDRNQPSAFFDLASVDCAHRRFLLIAWICAKGLEIVFANEPWGSLAHGFDVQPARHVPRCPA